MDHHEQLLIILQHLGRFRFGDAEGAPTYEVEERGSGCRLFSLFNRVTPYSSHQLLLTFGRDFVIPYFTVGSEDLRREACLACARLLANEEPKGRKVCCNGKFAYFPTSAPRRPPRLQTTTGTTSPFGTGQSTGQQTLRPVWEASEVHQWSHPKKKPLLRRALVYEVLAPLLRVITSDTSYTIRLLVLSELNNTSLDPDLCEKSHLHMLLTAINDEWMPIRRIAFSMWWSFDGWTWH